MKRFKQYLIEADTSIAQGTGEPTAQSVTPHFLPDYWQTPSIHPNTPPGQQEKPDNPNPPPDPIDWDKIREMLDEYQQLMDQIRRLLIAGNYDGIIALLQRMGITVPPNMLDGDSLSNWLQNYFEDLMEEQFERMYPNATPQQRNTFEEYTWEFLRRFLQNDPYAPPGWRPKPPAGIDSPRYSPIDINNPATWPPDGFNPNRPFDWPDIPGRDRYHYNPPSPYIPYDDRYNFSPNIG